MSLTAEQTLIALAHLGLGYTEAGGELVVDGQMPSDADLEAAYAEASAPKVDPLEARVAAVEARLDRAAQTQVTGDAAKVRDGLRPVS